MVSAEDVAKLSPKERKHVREHESEFFKALTAATFVIYKNTELVCMDKIRRPMALKAALKATGYDIVGFMPPRDAGKPYIETVAVTDRLFDAALKAAVEALKPQETEQPNVS